MKVYRYMSFHEFNLMEAGVTIVGRSYHDANTDSVGVCFLPELTYVRDGEAWTADKCLEFMSGIVTNDVLVEFETNETMTESWGEYADPYGDYDDTISIMELCIPQYNRSSMIPVRYAMGDTNWYDISSWCSV